MGCVLDLCFFSGYAFILTAACGLKKSRLLQGGFFSRMLTFFYASSLSFLAFSPALATSDSSCSEAPFSAS